MEQPCAKIKQSLNIIDLILRKRPSGVCEQFRFHALTMTTTCTCPKLARILLPVAYSSSNLWFARRERKKATNFLANTDRACDQKLQVRNSSVPLYYCTRMQYATSCITRCFTSAPSFTKKKRTRISISNHLPFISR
jgi:hypothetical protein